MRWQLPQTNLDYCRPKNINILCHPISVKHNTGFLDLYLQSMYVVAKFSIYHNNCTTSYIRQIKRYVRFGTIRIISFSCSTAECTFLMTQWKGFCKQMMYIWHVCSIVIANCILWHHVSFVDIIGLNFANRNIILHHIYSLGVKSLNFSWHLDIATYLLM